MVSEIASKYKYPEKMGGMHFINPPLRMLLVEVVKGNKTTRETLDLIAELSADIGKQPIIIEKDCRGFIMNRLLVSAEAEGLWSLYRGDKPEDIDTSVLNLGMPYGPIDGCDLVGLDTVYSILNNFREAYGDRFDFPEEIIKQHLEKGELGMKSGRGFYRWKGNKPIKGGAEPYDHILIIAVTVNEAHRIIEEGIADKDSINEIFKLGLNVPIGVFDIAEAVGYRAIVDALDDAYGKYGLELYKTCDLLREKA
jgi:enoyl-CoA hydratase/3-hydroxyacyl-CoA dehydrogenase